MPPLVTGLLCAAILGCSNSEPPTEQLASSQRPRTSIPPRLSVDAAGEALAAGERLFRDERLDDAEAIAEAVVARAPDDWQGHELLARVRGAKALHADRRRDAIAAERWRRLSADGYVHALRLRPDDAALQHACGVALIGARRPEEALLTFRRAGELAPEVAQYPLFEAQVLLGLERHDEAAQALARVLGLRPEEPFAHASLAECHRQRGDLESALAAIRTARRLEPGAMSFRVVEARLLRLAQRPREGLEILLAAGEAQWSDPGVVEEVALGWMALGEPTRAAEAWEASHRRHPENVAALDRAAEAWRQAGDPVRASVLEEERRLLGAKDELRRR